MKYSYDIAIAPGIRYECVADDSLHLKKGEEVVVQCERYEDYGTVVRCHDCEAANETRLRLELDNGDKGRRIQGQVIPAVTRRTTLVDKGKIHENAVRTKIMMKTVLLRIQEHRLDMKIVNIHVVFDMSLLVIQFTAEGRVDFRELLRDLSKVLHVRVELRQIGVRDEAGIQGGLGCCGRPFCCSVFLRDFHSINVRLAKEQGLSLNPSNISGTCGRLKCCLRYEAEGYKEMLKTLPRVGARCDTPEGPGKIVDLNPLTRRVRVVLTPQANEAYRSVDLGADEVTVKKTTPGGKPQAETAEGE